MFSPEFRERVRDRVFALARGDERVTGGALTGSSSLGGEDRWSDVDTSFGIAEGVVPEELLDEWTQELRPELGFVHHWDLDSGATKYRVYLLPGGLELDIAVTPAARFGPRAPSFKLIFGESSPQLATEPDPQQMIGYGWLYYLSSKAAIERGRLWSAEYLLSGLRDNTLALACVRVRLPFVYARGVDRLPAEIREAHEQTLVGELTSTELRRALPIARRLYLDEVGAVDEGLSRRLRAALPELEATP